MSEDEPLTGRKGTNIMQTSWNMMNCMVGSGLLTVPYAFRLAGLFGGILCMLVACVVNWYSALLLGRALEMAEADKGATGRFNMRKLGEVACGAMGGWLITLITAIELWVGLESFLVLLGINVHLITGLTQTTVIIAAGVLGFLTMALPLTSVARLSCLGVWCLMLGCVALGINGYGSWAHEGRESPRDAPPEYVLIDAKGMVPACGMLIFCFAGLPCIPNIRAGMQKPEHYTMAVHCSFIASLLYYLTVGLVGYYFYGQEVQESFTASMPPKPGQQHFTLYKTVAMVSAGLFSMKIQMGFPLYAVPVLALFGVESKTPGWYAWALRAAFVVFSVLCAVFLQNALSMVAAMSGAFMTTATSLVFPAICYLGMCRITGLSATKLMLVGALLAFGFFLSFSFFVHMHEHLYEVANEGRAAPMRAMGPHITDILFR